MVKMFRDCVVGCLLFSLFILVTAGCASAGTKTVWPDEFKQAYAGSTETTQDPDGLVGNGGYYAPITLPAGVQIKYIRVNYRRGSDYFPWCASLRRKNAAAPFEDVIKFDSPVDAEPYPTGDASLQSTAADVTGSRLVVKGYRYYILWEPLETGSLNSIQVVY